MKEELDLVRQFHEKFAQPILNEPSLIPTDRSDHRHSMMVEEVAEYKQAVDEKDLPGVAKELADILFVTYGTLFEHGLQDLAPAIFEEVAKSNLSKDIHEYKMIKGENYFKADIEKILKNKYTTDT